MAQKDYFELLNQPRAFAVDLCALSETKNALLARLHPDRFATASALEKRIAGQLTVQVNEAYATLADDLKRAQYLCSLAGINVNARKAMPANFLMRQMTWHEALESAQEANDAQALEALKAQVNTVRTEVLAALGPAFEVSDMPQAEALTRELMFIDKLLSQM